MHFMSSDIAAFQVVHFYFLNLHILEHWISILEQMHLEECILNCQFFSYLEVLFSIPLFSFRSKTKWSSHLLPYNLNSWPSKDSSVHYSAVSITCEHDYSMCDSSCWLLLDLGFWKEGVVVSSGCGSKEVESLWSIRLCFSVQVSSPADILSLTQFDSYCCCGSNGSKESLTFNYSCIQGQSVSRAILSGTNYICSSKEMWRKRC